MPRRTPRLNAAKTQSLRSLPRGQRATISGLSGGREFRDRLAALGFTPGISIKVLQNRRHGPLLVCVRGTRVALGGGEADKVQVHPEEVDHGRIPCRRGVRSRHGRSSR